MMIFEDRVSAYPNRYLLTREDGSKYYVILERADEPIIPGTPLNAETFNAMAESISPKRVIETGTENGLKYSLYSDGSAECWGELTVTVTEGSPTRADIYNLLPVVFTKIDSVQACVLYNDLSEASSKRVHVCDVTRFTEGEVRGLFIGFLNPSGLSVPSGEIRISVHVWGDGN